MTLDGIGRALAAVTIGIVVGILAERISAGSVFRSGLALVAAWLISGAVGAVLRLIRLGNRAGIVALSFGIREAALSFLLLLFTGLAPYLVLSVLGPAIHARLTDWRTLLLGLTGAVAGAGVSPSGVAYGGGSSDDMPSRQRAG